METAPTTCGAHSRTTHPQTARMQRAGCAEQLGVDSGILGAEAHSRESSKLRRRRMGIHQHYQDRASLLEAEAPSRADTSMDGRVRLNSVEHTNDDVEEEVNYSPALHVFLVRCGLTFTCARAVRVRKRRRKLRSERD